MQRRPAPGFDELYGGYDPISGADPPETNDNIAPPSDEPSGEGSTYPTGRPGGQDSEVGDSGYLFRTTATGYEQRYPTPYGDIWRVVTPEDIWSVTGWDSHDSWRGGRVPLDILNRSGAGVPENDWFGDWKPWLPPITINNYGGEGGQGGEGGDSNAEGGDAEGGDADSRAEGGGVSLSDIFGNIGAGLELFAGISGAVEEARFFGQDPNERLLSVAGAHGVTPHETLGKGGQPAQRDHAQPNQTSLALLQMRNQRMNTHLGNLAAVVSKAIEVSQGDSTVATRLAQIYANAADMRITLDDPKQGLPPVSRAKMENVEASTRYLGQQAETEGYKRSNLFSAAMQALSATGLNYSKQREVVASIIRQLSQADQAAASADQSRAMADQASALAKESRKRTDVLIPAQERELRARIQRLQDQTSNEQRAQKIAVFQHLIKSRMEFVLQGTDKWVATSIRSLVNSLGGSADDADSFSSAILELSRVLAMSPSELMKIIETGKLPTTLKKLKRPAADVTHSPSYVTPYKQDERTHYDQGPLQ